ncbi:MAG TPA: TraR/DksA C4-type zinc finger protein [Anaerohalosphaeraceae bacterium]|nr:TraR/DksA C4-type zinc finger protein [Anaerohalosphaeraceae bacterium]
MKKPAKKTTAKKAVPKTVAKTAKSTAKSAAKTGRKTSIAKKAGNNTKSLNNNTEVSPPKKSILSSVPKAVQGSTKTYLSPEKLEYFRQMLLEKLHQLRGDVDSIESEALRKNSADSSGNLSTMPIHMADLGSDTFEQDFALGLMSGERKIVAEIIAALKRIQDGTYGICEGTGKPIPIPRLEACPWARYCVDYAAKLEKGQVSLQEKSYRTAAKTRVKDEDEEVVESEEPDEEEDVEESEEEEVEEGEYDHLETDPDLEDLYEIEDGPDSPPSK